MKNFQRVVRLALVYRWSVAAAFLCAFSVAFLWVANIGTIYPFVEVVLNGQSLHDWIDNEIETSEASADQLQLEIASLEQQKSSAPPDQRKVIEQEISDKSLKRYSALKALEFRRWARPYVHGYLPKAPFSAVILIVVFLLVGTLVKDFFLIAGRIIAARLAQRATFQLRKDFYRRTLDMEMANFTESGTSDLMSRFTHDSNQIAAGIQMLFGAAIREPLKMIGCFTAAAFISWRLLLVSLLIAPVAAFAIHRLSGSIKRANRRAMEEMSQIYNTLAETLGAIKAVKAFTMENHERDRFDENGKQYYRKAMKIARYDALIRPTTELMGICTICLAILAGAYLVLNQETHLLGIKMSDKALPASLMMLFYGLLAGVSDPARKLSSVFLTVQRGIAASDRIYEMLDRDPAIADPEDPIALPRHEEAIRFEGVHFGYLEGESILKGVDLEIPFGKTYAIVGANGSGKSTLANLVPRFYDPDQGRVTIDGVDLRATRQYDIRRQIGLVTQEPLLFNESVADNIRYGNPEASEQAVFDAARQAHADRFIREQLEDGYETLVGERGGRLSGGQRQRITLARAILRDPSILILDEATSQVDMESEHLVHQVLKEFIRGRTTLIITHRRSTLELADQIVVMESGKIADIGNHDELVACCNAYRRLFDQDLRASA